MCGHDGRGVPDRRVWSLSVSVARLARVGSDIGPKRPTMRALLHPKRPVCGEVRDDEAMGGRRGGGHGLDALRVWSRRCGGRTGGLRIRFGCVVAGDLSRACELLAPATRATLEYQQPQPCPQALLGDNLHSGPIGQVEVWGGEARAHAGSDTLFLTRTRQGWRIAAAGCVPQGDNVPYLCKVSGP